MRQVKILCLSGPMWSGKTTLLRGIAEHSSRAIVVAPFDTRRSDRDLTVLHPNDCYTREEFFEGYCEDEELWIFDESHLWLKGWKVDFAKVLDLSSKGEGVRRVCFSGIHLDYYNAFEPFPHWAWIKGECRARRLIHAETLMSSLRPCWLCGSGHDVRYSMPLPGAAMVGNEYVNICFSCVAEGGATAERRIQEKLQELNNGLPR